MLTQQEFIQIRNYCKENRVPIRTYLKDHKISRGDYALCRRIYLNQSAEDGQGSFIEITPKKTSPASRESLSLSVDIRNSRGISVRIQGDMSCSQLKDILTTLTEVPCFA